MPGMDDCSWPIDTSCAQTEWDAYSPEVQQRATALATATLRRLSGYRVGGCPIVVRPCVQSCVSRAAFATTGWGPAQRADGSWVNTCGCRTECSCTSLCEVVLAAPVGPVSWVKVDGLTLPATDYRVFGDRLVWMGDGECRWPVCQDMTLADTEPGTFAVRYLNAHDPDSLAATAAGVLAVEFARACGGSKSCRLPANVTAVSRQGVSFEIAAGAFQNGLTGIREVDSWLGLWNPQQRQQATSVWWPGKPTPRLW